MLLYNNTIVAWHASGTYCFKTKTGGSNGATMRFPPESTDGANAGLEHARYDYMTHDREFLEPIKKAYPSMSYADIWTLAGVVAIESMGGPQIPWSPGRVDKRKETLVSSDIPPNGRLPDVYTFIIFTFRLHKVLIMSGMCFIGNLILINLEWVLMTKKSLHFAERTLWVDVILIDLVILDHGLIHLLDFLISILFYWFLKNGQRKNGLARNSMKILMVI